MRKILGIASLIMSTGVVHAEQLNEQEQISPYSATVGLAHQFKEKWGASTDVSWDSGTGDPASTMGPIKGS